MRGLKTMLRTLLITATLLTFALVSLVAGDRTYASDFVERKDLYAAFDSAGVTGSMVVYDVAADRFILVNKARAEQRFVPASTFKIANSLIALATRAVKDENEIIPYGGQPQPMKSWEKNMSMRDAIPISAVPIYQELARRIGLTKYREWLAKLNYGNKLIGADVETFWLKGPLAISAVEQTQFNARLAAKKLNASQRSQSLVRDILRLEDNKKFELFGKTGWSQKIGWWSGWIERDGRVFAFALNMDMPTVADAPKRITIAKAILAKLDLYQSLGREKKNQTK